jgi:hypothetical protein
LLNKLFDYKAFFFFENFDASQSLDKTITMKRQGKQKTFFFSTLVTSSFLQTQSTHKLQNKQKHKNSRTCGF